MPLGFQKSNRRWTLMDTDFMKSNPLERTTGKRGEESAEILSYQRSSASICG
jgi:hypothetical protein